MYATRYRKDDETYDTTYDKFHDTIHGTYDDNHDAHYDKTMILPRISNCDKTCMIKLYETQSNLYDEHVIQLVTINVIKCVITQTITNYD